LADRAERDETIARERLGTACKRSKAVREDGISDVEFLKRPALQRMLRAAEAGAFDLIVCRDLDRIGRDPRSA